MVTQYTVTSKPIRINVKLTPAQVQTLRNRLVKLFPVLATLRSQRRVQMVNACGQFRIITLAGAQLPTCLTQAMVSRMIAAIQGEDVMVTAGGDPVLEQWQRDGSQKAGATWLGNYDDVDGHGEMRLALASN